MPNSYTRIWTHLLFPTRDGEPLIAPAIESLVHTHMRAQLIELRCPVKIISGTADHVHALFLTNPALALNDIVKQVKGNTSHWINAHRLCPVPFAWQKGFAAFTIGENLVRGTVGNISAQKEIHRHKTYLQELDELIAANGLVPQASTY